MASSAQTNIHVLAGSIGPSRIAKPAALLAIALTGHRPPAVWRQVQTAAGKVGLWFLIAAGLGGAMASVFDLTHETGHGIAVLLFPTYRTLYLTVLAMVMSYPDITQVIGPPRGLGENEPKLHVPVS
jgi:hypothetical protein